MFRIHELFLTFFYFGKFKTAPGTVGSVISLFCWLAYATVARGLGISFASQNIFWAVFLIAAFIYGSLATPKYSKKFNQIDHQTIVLDEVIGQIIALQISFALIHETYFQEPVLMIIHQLSAFFAFRFFDIKKPSIIGKADQMKSGLGVMLDDVFAGLFAALAVIILTISYFIFMF